MKPPLGAKLRRLAAVVAAVTALIGRAHDYVSWAPVSNGDLANIGNWNAAQLNSNTFLRFDGATSPLYQPTLNSSVLVGGLEFSSSTVSYTLSGTGLLQIGEYNLSNSSAVAQTIQVPLELTATGDYNRIYNNGAGLLTIAGSITNNSGMATKLAGAGEGGAVSGVISGSSDLIKYGSGTWTLSGANTFTGTLYVEEGMLVLAGTNATTLTEITGGTLKLTNELALQNSAVTLSANGTLAFEDITSATLGSLAASDSGAVLALQNGGESIYGVDLTVGGDNTDTTFAGAISGDGSLIKVGTGTLTLSCTNSYSGTTTIRGGALAVQSLSNGGADSGIGSSSNAAANLVLNGGTLLFTGYSVNSTDRLFTLGSDGGTISVSSNGALSFTNTGAIAFVTPGTAATLKLVADGNYAPNQFASLIANNVGAKTNLTKDGVGEWALSAANTFSGTTRILAGKLTLSNSLALQNSTVDLSTGASLVFRGVTTATLGALASSDGTSSLALVNDDATPAALALTVGGNDVSTTFSGTLSGAGSLTKTGAGTLTLAGINTYVGGTTISGGTVAIPADSALGSASAGLTLAGGTLKLANLSAAFTSARDIALGTGGGTISTNSYEGTFSGVISGTGGLTHKGSGVLTLSGANTYTGGTTVTNGGVLDFTADNNLGATASGVTLNGGYLRTRANVSDFTHAIALGANGGTFNTYGHETTISGVISGGAFTVQSQSSNGTLTLSAANTYSGGTYLGVAGYYSGYLTLAHAGGGTLPAGGDITLYESSVLRVATNQTIRGLFSTASTPTVILNEGQTLTINLPDAQQDSTHSTATYAGVISGAGTLEINGPGAFTLTGTHNTYSGGTLFSAGTLRVGSDASFGATTGDLTFNGGQLQATAGFNSARNVTLNNNGGTIDTQEHILVFSGQISGDGGLTKQGSGTLRLSGGNGYSGTTTVSAGKLEVAATNSLPTQGKVSVASGATLSIAADQKIDSFVDSVGASVEIALGKRLMLALDAAVNQPTTLALIEGAQTYGQITNGTPSYFDGVMSGAGGLTVGQLEGASRWLVMTKDNTYTGGTIINSSGVLQLGNYASGGSIVGNVVDNGRLIFLSSAGANFSGTISGTGIVSVGKTLNSSSVGQVELSAANTYTGGTDIYTGGLLATNSTGSATGTGEVVVRGGYLGGTGAISGDVHVYSGGTIMPGEKGLPGTLSVGSLDIAGGATFAFQINDATGQAGTNYSLLNIAGALSFSATSSDPWVVALYTFGGSGQQQQTGTLANFDPAQAYHWQIAQASGGVTGFNASSITFDTSGFVNSFTGSFGMSQSGNSLFLDYNPSVVPEPSTWVLLAVGSGLVLLAHRRRSRRG